MSGRGAPAHPPPQQVWREQHCKPPDGVALWPESRRKQFVPFSRRSFILFDVLARIEDGGGECLDVRDDDIELIRYMCSRIPRRVQGVCCGGADLALIVRMIEFQHAGCVCKGGICRCARVGRRFYPGTAPRGARVGATEGLGRGMIPRLSHPEENTKGVVVRFIYRCVDEDVG